jgi:heme exporter protein D
MSFSEFLDMSGYGAYVWSAYAIAIGGLVLNIWLARRQLRVAREEARRRLAMQETP